jgi:predicted RNA polymerase sigma factor
VQVFYTSPGNQDLQQHRPYLLRYAMLQLRDRDLAEDVVQETLLAVLEGRAGFSGNSSHKTWLTGILKHKIIDMMLCDGCTNFRKQLAFIRAAIRHYRDGGSAR